MARWFKSLTLAVPRLKVGWNAPSQMMVSLNLSIRVAVAVGDLLKPL